MCVCVCVVCVCVCVRDRKRDGEKLHKKYLLLTLTGLVSTRTPLNPRPFRSDLRASSVLTDQWHVLEVNVALRPHRPYGLLGTGSQGRPPRLSHNMHTSFVEYAMLVDLKAQAPQLQTVPHELTQVNITVIAIFISLT